MSARSDHRDRVMAGASEEDCWRTVFDEIDRLRAEVAALKRRDDLTVFDNADAAIARVESTTDGFHCPTRPNIHHAPQADPSAGNTMNARDDYPMIDGVHGRQWGRMCDEIDRLRAALDIAMDNVIQLRRRDDLTVFDNADAAIARARAEIARGGL